MKKSFLKLTGLALAAVLVLGILGCSDDSDSSSHVHTFSAEWTKDATHHWHAATCEHTAEVKDKAEHNFGEWTTTEQPSEEAEGKKERKCSDCQYLAEETIAKLPVPAGSVAKASLTINGTEISKTSEVVVIPEGTVAAIEMTDDSAWSGFVSSIESDKRDRFFKIKFWDHKDIVREFLDNYDKLDDWIKAKVPLKKIWVPEVIEDIVE